VRSTATNWTKNSVIAVDAGSHLAAITRILERDFPLVSDPHFHQPPNPRNGNGHGNGDSRGDDSPLSRAALVQLSDDESENGTPFSEREAPMTITTLKEGAFAGLPFPHASARANALHIVREHVSTYLITHPHLDHLSGFVINTAAFHNTSRPKRLAALPFTINAIKTHIFNNVIWPNLTDEEGGVGLVTFQRLAEGGNIALGEGSGRGFIEVCDGIGVKGFRVSHGHCMRGPGHLHRGSNADLPETPGLQRSLSAHHHASIADGHEGRSLSFSLPTQSAPGTPGLISHDQGRRASGATPIYADHCVIDSTAYFIRTESTPTTPKREVLIFGDVEPDSLSLSPRTALIWAEAAPKIAAGILTGVFIEVSYTNAQGDAVLFGHLAPRHLLAELQTLAEMVRESRKEFEREKEEARKGRKRKRNSQHLDGGVMAERKAKLAHLGVGRGVDTPLSIKEGTTDDEGMTDYSYGHTGTHTPNPHAQQLHTPTPHSSTPTALNLSVVSAEHNRAHLAAAFDAPLKGLKVIIIHVKDTLSDGPLMGEQILNELVDGEREASEVGKGLGCVFEVSRSGESYWF
jgi:cAMP phosphodiesterase